MKECVTMGMYMYKGIVNIATFCNYYQISFRRIALSFLSDCCVKDSEESFLCIKTFCFKHLFWLRNKLFSDKPVYYMAVSIVI